MSDYALHELKTWPIPFAEVWSGNKLHEIRKADRPFKRGDSLLLKEWSPETKEYSGRWVLARVTYLTEAGAWGLPPDSCVMSIVVEGKSLNATANPPAGGVPAARPEGEPGAAAVFTNWERAFWEVVFAPSLSNATANAVIAKHTHPAPEGLAARMRDHIELERHIPCQNADRCTLRDAVDPGSVYIADRCDDARLLLVDATPAAVAALDRAAAERATLRALLSDAMAVIEAGAHVGCWAVNQGRCYAGIEGAPWREQEQCARVLEFRWKVQTEAPK